jgi:hypothetical protein
MLEVDLSKIEAKHANETAVAALVNFLEHRRVYSSPKATSGAVRWLQHTVRSEDWSVESFNYMEHSLKVSSEDLDLLVTLTQAVIKTDDAI